MKIVYYLPSLYISGGLERIITLKANYFAEHFDDYEVVILTSEQCGKEPYYKLSEKIKHIDIDVPFDFPLNQSKLEKLIKYPFKYGLFKKRFTQKIYELAPDVVISTLRRELNFITKLKDKSVKIGELHISRYFYHSHSIQNNNQIIKALKNYWDNIFLANLKKLDKVVVLTNEEAAYWPELSNCMVINNFLTFYPEENSPCTSNEVIAVGRYSHQKGFDMLINAWEIVAKRNPDWILKIYGEGNREDLNNLIIKYKISDSCFLKHPTSDIANRYLESSIYVLSSRFEGMPMVLLEAIASGLPVVSFDCPCGPKDIINHEVDGILVKSGNIEELADKICYLIENENIRKEMGLEARKNAERFKIEHISLLWKNLFEELTKNKN